MYPNPSSQTPTPRFSFQQDTQISSRGTQGGHRESEHWEWEGKVQKQELGRREGMEGSLGLWRMEGAAGEVSQEGAPP